MDLVNIQRRIINRMLLLLFPEGAVAPAEAADVIQLAGGGGPGLRVEAVGVRFHPDLAVPAQDRVFVRCISRQSRNKALPNLILAGHGVRGRIPAIKIAHHGNTCGMRSPDPEGPARFSAFFRWVGAKPLPAIREGTLMETLHLFIFCHGSSSSPRPSKPAGSFQIS